MSEKVDSARLPFHSEELYEPLHYEFRRIAMENATYTADDMGIRRAGVR
jgi:hypothetical protein